MPCCCGAGRAAIDRQLLAAGLTAANPPHIAAAGGWDRKADGHRTFQTLLRIICGQCQKQLQRPDDYVGKSSKDPLNCSPECHDNVFQFARRVSVL